MELTIKKSHIRLVGALTLFILILGVAFFVKPNMTGKVISEDIVVGETGILYIEGSDVVLLAASLEDLVELMKAASEINQEKYYAVFQDGRAFIVSGGTQAGIVENNSEVSVVQILEGDFEGAYGWVLSEWIITD